MAHAIGTCRTAEFGGVYSMSLVFIVFTSSEGYLSVKLLKYQIAKGEGWCFFTRGYFKEGRLLER